MASLNFTWSDTENDISNMEYRLYENGSMVVDNIGQLNFSLIKDESNTGVFEYYVTAVDTTTQLESLPSETVSVNFTQPESPTGLSVSLEV